MPWLELVVAAGIGYLVGAIPSGVLIGRLRGIDPRDSGSGRTGTTNAIRTLGPGLAVAVAALDLGKGIAAVLIGNAIGVEPLAGALAGVAAVIGHVKSVFIGFHGGRGVATGAGAMLVLAPITILVAVPELLLVIWATRLVSLASLSAATTVAIVSIVLYVVGWVGAEVVVAAVLIGVVVVLSHFDNIGRLLAGTERRFGRD
jgi:acyl phosphate:glycerol-3-phosphate acyltransferase